MEGRGRWGWGQGPGLYGHREAALTPAICPSPEKNRQLLTFASLAYLFKSLQRPAKFKCGLKTGTYKACPPGSEEFHNGQSVEQ